VDATANLPSQAQVPQERRLSPSDRLSFSRRQHCKPSLSVGRHAAGTCGRRLARVAFGDLLRRLPPSALSIGCGVLLAVLIGGAASHARSEALWQAVRGADLHTIFSDHELADGVHYAYQFRGDGTFTGFAMGKEIHGTWRLAGNEFCWMQRKFTAVEECFEVERRGSEIRFLRDGYESFSGNLSPIKAQAPSRVPR